MSLNVKSSLVGWSRFRPKDGNIVEVTLSHLNQLGNFRHMSRD